MSKILFKIMTIMYLKRNTLLLLLLIFNVAFSGAKPINFEKGTWKEVLDKAKKEKKKIFVDAFATWCGPCKKMDASTFSNDSVGDFFNKYFVCFKIDMESPAGLEFGKQNPVGSYPTFMFFDSDGKKISEQKGYRDPADFLKLGKAIVFPEQTELYKLTKQYEKGKRDKKFLYQLLLAKNEANVTAEPKMIEEYFMGIPSDSLFSPEPFIMYYLYHDSLESGYTLFFIKNYQTLLGMYGNYAISKVDNLINKNIEIAARHKDRTHLDKIKKFAANFVEAARLPQFEQQIEKSFMMQVSRNQ